MLLDKNDVLLDYGCGTGQKTCELAEHVNKIHAIDISSKMIDLAKRKAKERNTVNIDFVRVDLFDEKYKDESFNVILAMNILYLLDNDLKAIQRIK